MQAISDLYNLRPDEFEGLCADILRSDGYTDVSEVGGPNDQGIDIIGKKGDQLVAVQVKHTIRPLHRHDVIDIVDRIARSSFKAEKIILMTSSPVEPSLTHDIPVEIPLEIIGPEDILNLLSRNSALQNEKIREAKRRRNQQIYSITLSILAVIFSVFGLLTSSFTLQKGRDRPDLENRIMSVDSALEGIRGLENHLTQIKSDLETTAAESKQIRAEYEKALQLKTLTSDHLMMMKRALESETWQQKLFNYALGFVLGIASSITASIIYTRIQQRKALNK